MSIHATCSCGKQLLIPVAMAGQTVACIRCARPLELPRLAVIQAAPSTAKYHLHRGPVPAAADENVLSAAYDPSAFEAVTACAALSPTRRFAGGDVTGRLRRMGWANRCEDLRQIGNLIHEQIIEHPRAVLITFGVIVLGSVVTAILA